MAQEKQGAGNPPPSPAAAIPPGCRLLLQMGSVVRKGATTPDEVHEAVVMWGGANYASAWTAQEAATVYATLYRRYGQSEEVVQRGGAPSPEEARAFMVRTEAAVCGWLSWGMLAQSDQVRAGDWQGFRLCDLALVEAVDDYRACYEFVVRCGYPLQSNTLTPDEVEALAASALVPAELLDFIEGLDFEGWGEG